MNKESARERAHVVPRWAIVGIVCLGGTVGVTIWQVVGLLRTDAGQGAVQEVVEYAKHGSDTGLWQLEAKAEALAGTVEQFPNPQWVRPQTDLAESLVRHARSLASAGDFREAREAWAAGVESLEATIERYEQAEAAKRSEAEWLSAANQLSGDRHLSGHRSVDVARDMAQGSRKLFDDRLFVEAQQSWDRAASIAFVLLEHRETAQVAMEDAKTRWEGRRPYSPPLYAAVQRGVQDSEVIAQRARKHFDEGQFSESERHFESALSAYNAALRGHEEVLAQLDDSHARWMDRTERLHGSERYNCRLLFAHADSSATDAAKLRSSGAFDRARSLFDAAVDLWQQGTDCDHRLMEQCASTAADEEADRDLRWHALEVVLTMSTALTRQEILALQSSIHGRSVQLPKVGELTFVWVPIAVSPHSSDAVSSWQGTGPGKGYWLGQTEVSQDQFAASMGSNPSWYRRPAHPVTNVSWKEATDYCDAITREAQAAGEIGLREAFRLPSEAQWEYATSIKSQGWLDSGLPAPPLSGEADRRQTRPVRDGVPNGLGALNMGGNVAEWCGDHWRSGESRRTETCGFEAIPWIDNKVNFKRVVRGSGFKERTGAGGQHLRRGRLQTTTASDVGFRVVLVETGPEVNVVSRLDGM
jgi:formylglycine-generating enzyme required for sulfatase activity